MGARASVFAVIVFAILVLSAAPMVGADPIPFTPPSEHESVIEIFGDKDFTAKRWVVDGSGVSGDPYIIQDLDLNLYHAMIGLYIHSTRATFAIKNVTINKPPISAGRHGIVLDDVRNATISRCEVVGTQTGISVERSENITLAFNNVSDTSEVGLTLDACTGSSVFGNLVNRSFWGITMIDDRQAQLDHNTIKNAQYGVTMIRCSQVHADNNLMIDTNVDYSDDSWTGNLLPDHARVIDQALGKLLILGFVVPACITLAVGTFILRGRKVKNAAH